MVIFFALGVLDAPTVAVGNDKRLAVGTNCLMLNFTCPAQL